METMLSAVREKFPQVDTREGSIVYTALAPAATEFRKLYDAMENVLVESFADTASRHHLMRRAAERGLTPRYATPAIVRGQFTPTNIDLEGQRFNVNSLTFSVFDRMSGGQYRLRCETPGEAGNISEGKLIPVSFINGLETARIVELLIPGREEEETEAFRQRYFNSFRSRAFGGNVAHYIEEVTAIAGVGACKVFPVWDGGGTVRVCIIGSDFNVPSAALIDDVQTRLDPTQNNGEGLGIAPIGHLVTVTGAQAAAINIASSLTYQIGFDWSAVRVRVEEAIDAYFAELARDWANHDRLVVRISQIETRLLNINGILDINGTTLNGQARNVELGTDDIPVRGTVTDG